MTYNYLNNVYPDKRRNMNNRNPKENSGPRDGAHGRIEVKVTGGDNLSPEKRAEYEKLAQELEKALENLSRQAPASTTTGTSRREKASPYFETVSRPKVVFNERQLTAILSNPNVFTDSELKTISYDISLYNQLPDDRSQATALIIQTVKDNTQALYRLCMSITSLRPYLSETVLAPKLFQPNQIELIARSLTIQYAQTGKDVLSDLLCKLNINPENVPHNSANTTYYEIAVNALKLVERMNLSQDSEVKKVSEQAPKRLAKSVKDNTDFATKLKAAEKIAPKLVFDRQNQIKLFEVLKFIPPQMLRTVIAKYDISALATVDANPQTQILILVDHITKNKNFTRFLLCLKSYLPNIDIRIFDQNQKSNLPKAIIREANDPSLSAIDENYMNKKWPKQVGEPTRMKLINTILKLHDDNKITDQKLARIAQVLGYDQIDYYKQSSSPKRTLLEKIDALISIANAKAEIHLLLTALKQFCNVSINV